MLGINVLLVATVCLLFYLQNQQEHAEWVKSGVPKIGQIVISDRDMPEGSIIKESDIFERRILPSEKRYPNIVVCKDLAIGKKVKWGLGQGRIVQALDLEEKDEILEQQIASIRKTGNPRAICSHEKPPESPERAYTGAVYATANIPEGESIPLNALEFKEVEPNEVNSDSAIDFGMIAGWPAEYGVRFGTQLCLNDADTSSLSKKVKAYLAAREISKDDKISAEAIKMVPMPCVDCPRSAILLEELILGRKAIRKIKQGSIICSYMLNPEDSLRVIVKKDSQ